jgi:hypothetical protein
VIPLRLGIGRTNVEKWGTPMKTVRHGRALLGGVELPVTDPDPFDYQVIAGLVKVF